MKAFLVVFAGCGMWLQATASSSHDLEPTNTITQVGPPVQQTTDDLGKLSELENIAIAAVVPTQSGQIGVDPPGPEPTPANIGKNTKYLTEEDGSTKWKGPHASHIAVATTTRTDEGGKTAVATLIKGVSAQKNDEGGLDILISPAVKAKLESIAKDVTACGNKRRRRGAQSSRKQKREGPACGLADFVQRVGADDELQDSFSRPLTDQTWHEVDSGYGSDDPSEDPAWEGDGGSGGSGGQDGDEGYFSQDDEGFFEGAEGADEDIVETIVFSSEEEAAAIGEALSGADAAAAAGIWGGSTVTAGSFLAFLWTTLKDGKPVAHANHIPSESIHRVTKTKTQTSATSTASGCPQPTGTPPGCSKGCSPTSVEVKDAKTTGIVDWKCTKGDSKGCRCNPETEDRVTIFHVDFQRAVFDSLKAVAEELKKPQTKCSEDITNVPSEFLVNMTSKSFCEEVMKDIGDRWGPAAYDIHGDKIPSLRMSNSGQASVKRSLQERSPPEVPESYEDYRFFLTYRPQEDECLLPEDDLCSQALEALVRSPCGSNHGSAGNRMFVEASIDVGCGKFTWNVVEPFGSTPKPKPKPKPKPSLGNRDCHDRHKHIDVRKQSQKFWSEKGCRIFGDERSLKAGDDAKEWSSRPMQYRVSWIDGCDSVEEQSIEFPVEDDESISCASIMEANYNNCNNGGAGGVVDVGCLRYDFYAK